MPLVPLGRRTPRRRRGPRGQSIVELALILPVLLILVGTAVDLGRVFYGRITIANAAREGAFEAAKNPASFQAGAACDTSTNRIMCRVINESAGTAITVDPADVAVSCSPSCSSTYGTEVTVTVTGHFTLLTPILGIFFGGQELAYESSATAAYVRVPTSPVATPTPSPTPTPTGTATASASPSPTPTPVPCALPTVGFTSSQQNKNRPVVFTSTSTPTSGACAISNWRWDFGDGVIETGNVPTVSHDYPAQGATYNVTLAVTNPAGVAFFIQSVTTKS